MAWAQLPGCVDSRGAGGECSTPWLFGPAGSQQAALWHPAGWASRPGAQCVAATPPRRRRLTRLAAPGARVRQAHGRRRQPGGRLLPALPRVPGAPDAVGAAHAVRAAPFLPGDRPRPRTAPGRRRPRALCLRSKAAGRPTRARGAQQCGRFHHLDAFDGNRRRGARRSAALLALLADQAQLQRVGRGLHCAPGRFCACMFRPVPLPPLAEVSRAMQELPPAPERAQRPAAQARGRRRRRRRGAQPLPRPRPPAARRRAARARAAKARRLVAVGEPGTVGCHPRPGAVTLDPMPWPAHTAAGGCTVLPGGRPGGVSVTCATAGLVETRIHVVQCCIRGDVAVRLRPADRALIIALAMQWGRVDSSKRVGKCRLHDRV